jgi:hypothetical protein
VAGSGLAPARQLYQSRFRSVRKTMTARIGFRRWDIPAVDGES